MPTLHLAILALIQGITEFLPISSSAHLAATPQLFGWTDQGLVIDVAVHVGTLGAVVLYMHREIWDMVSGLGRMMKGRRDRGAKLAGLVILATLPVIGAGLALDHYYPNGLRSLEVIAWATLGFGILLYIADGVGMTLRRIEHLEISDTVLIGLAQCLALIPGTSRSGITITVALMIGLGRTQSAHFSFLLAIPTILGAQLLMMLDLSITELLSEALIMLSAATLAGLSAYVCIHFFIALVERTGMRPYVYYRIALGLMLFGFVATV